ncbi:MAG: ABC transporter substrate-binding protein [Oscillospiraceae bacterium]|nr:ABC transporter substrate-binding protein [Oscillospiraceae bacterium]
MKKLLALILTLLMVFSLVACGGKNADTDTNTGNEGTNDTVDTGSPDGGDTGSDGAGSESGETRDYINIAYSQDRGTLDPIYLMGYDAGDALKMVYENLWSYNIKGEKEWNIATSFEMVEPTRWRITIRDDVKFANGNPLTAEDVVFSINRANTRVGEPAYFPMLDLENTKVIDSTTIEVAYLEYDFSYEYTFGFLPIMDEESFDENTIAQTPMGSGPYEVTDYVVNSHMTLTARDDYWGTAPAIKTLNFRLFTEDMQKTNALQTGELDITTAPFQDISFISTLDGYTVDIYDNAQSMALYFSLDPASAFAENEKARQAVCAAIDTQAIVDIAYSGYGSPSVMPISKGNIDATENLYNKGVYGTGYNVEAAKQLAEEAGIVGQTITLITDGSSAMVVMAELIQFDLDAIGVTVEILNLDAGSVASVYEDPSQYDMAISFTNVPSKTVAQNMYAWVTYTFQGVYVKNPWEGRDEYLGLTNGIMAVSDTSELASRYEKLIDIHTKAVPWFSLCDQASALAYNSDLEGYELGLMGGINYAKLSWK